MTDDRPFLTARWMHLVMLNYEVPPAVLAPFVPHGTALDTFDGRTLASMVGFRFLDTRVLGVPVPFHRDFDEVNLRFYVRRVVDDEVRRGVVFVKEIVPRAAIAWIARVVYQENYVALPMSHDVELSGDAPRATYGWRLGDRAYRLEARASGAPFLPGPDSEECFISEHYWGYAAQRDGSTVEYRVTHPQWRVWSVGDAVFEGDVAALYGAAFAPHLTGAPSSAFLAEGSAVTVMRGVRLPRPDR